MTNYPKWQTFQIWQVRYKTSGSACSRHPWGHFPTHPLHTGAQEFKFFILFFHLTFILLLEHILSIFLSKTSLFFRPLPDVSFVFPTEEKLFSIPSFINSLGHFSFPRSSNGHGKRLQEEVVEFFYILATCVNRGFPIICTCKTIQCKIYSSQKKYSLQTNIPCKTYSLQTNIPCHKNFLKTIFLGEKVYSWQPVSIAASPSCTWKTIHCKKNIHCKEIFIAKK